MAVTHLCGFDTNSTADFVSLSAATVAVQSTITRTGGFALRVHTTANTGSVTWSSRAAGGTARALYRSCRFYLRVASLPSANTAIAASGKSGSGALFSLRLNTTGTLSLVSNAAVRATSTNALTADGAWHRIDFDCGWSAGSGMRVFVDGVSWVSDTTDTGVVAATSANVGVSSAANADLYFDDVVFYDSALPATLNDYSVNLLLPATDSAIGGWTDGAGGTSTLAGSVDNVPPVGVAASTAAAKIKSATNSASDNYDATCAVYTSITGLTTQAQVLAVQALCNDAQESTTGSPKAGAVVITTNPSGQTEQSFDYGIPNSTNGSTAAAAAGTFATGWGTHVGPVTETPTLTMGNGPVVRVGKRTATAQVVDVDFMGVYVMWGAAGTAYTSSLSGGLSFTGTHVKTCGKAASAALSFTGSQSRAITHVLAGVLSFTGSTVKATTRSLTGAALTFTGAALKSTARAVAGVLTSGGTVVKLTARPLAGTASFVGSTSRYTARSVSAVLSFTSDLVKSTSRALAGAVDLTGALVKQTARNLAGGLSFTGLLSSVLTSAGIVYTLALDAALDFAGAVSRSTSRTFAATADFTAAIVRATDRALSSAVGFTGSIARRTARALVANLSLVGSTTRAVTRSVSAVLTFTGSTAKTTGRLLAGGVSFTGSQSKRVGKALAGAVRPTGSIVRRTSRPLAAVLAPVGVVAKRTARDLTATLSTVGTFVGTSLGIIRKAVLSVTSRLVRNVRAGDISQMAMTASDVAEDQTVATDGPVRNVRATDGQPKIVGSDK